MQSSTWAKVLKYHRCRLNLTSKKLAQKAGIDPSYITLMERGGHIPRREKVIALARAMEMDADALLLAAGYVPDSAERSGNASVNFLFGSFIPELRLCLCELLELSKQQQREAAGMLFSYLNVSAGRSGRRG